MPLIGSVLKLLAKRVLIPLGLIVGASATDAVIHKKYLISNEEVNDIMKIIKSLEESCLLIKGVGETIEAAQSKWSKKAKSRIFQNVNKHFSC